MTTGKGLSRKIVIKRWVILSIMLKKQACAYSYVPVNSIHLKIAGEKFNLDVNAVPPPANEDFWATVQKCYSFDEPGSRCARLKKALGKQLKAPRAKEVDLSSATQNEQDHLFDAVFGGRTASIAHRVLNLLFALEEMERFDEIAYASWAIEAGEIVSTDSLSEVFARALNEFLEAANLSSGQRRWLVHSAIAAPDLARLKEPGPWQSEPLAVFLEEMLGEVEKIDVTDARGFVDAHTILSASLPRYRAQLPDDFLPSAIVIVEGQTEKLLLPEFARALSIDWGKTAVMIVSAGGAKQVARRYLFLRDLVALPIVCLLDRDAQEQADLITDSIRDCDQLIVLEAGEIEDTFDAAAFARYLNLYLKTLPGSVQIVSSSDFPPKMARKAILHKLWKDRKLGDFDKVAFAHSLMRNLDTASDVPGEMVHLIKILSEVAREHA